MNLQEEIARVAWDLYEKSGYKGGREFDNWLEAERIVLTRHAGQEMEEPEEMIGEDFGGTADEEGSGPGAGAYASREGWETEEQETTVIEEREAQPPAAAPGKRPSKLKPARKKASEKASAGKIKAAPGKGSAPAAKKR